MATIELHSLTLKGISLATECKELQFYIQLIFEEYILGLDLGLSEIRKQYIIIIHKLQNTVIVLIKNFKISTKSN